MSNLFLSADLSIEQIEDIIHDLLLINTGLQGDLIRPAFQDVVMPEKEVDWLAFQVNQHEKFNATFPSIKNGHETLQEHEQITVNLTFYGNNSFSIAGNTRSMLMFARNREILAKNNMELVSVEDRVYMPELINGSWVKRTDMSITICREINRKLEENYILDGNINIITDKGAI